MAILRAVRPEQPQPEAYVFTGRGSKTGLSNMSLSAVLRRMGKREITVHGFRSTFRDWAAESTQHPRELAEAALAHTLKDKVEAAYRRGDLFDKRRTLMNDWAAYCASNTVARAAGQP
jgi:integrase